MTSRDLMTVHCIVSMGEEGAAFLSELLDLQQMAECWGCQDAQMAAAEFLHAAARALEEQALRTMKSREAARAAQELWTEERGL